MIQAGLSLRLVWGNTAFGDEGLYLWSGHLEWAHWLHGTPVPNFAAYFSGAPVVYPPIGAVADSIGGLAAARILSMIFMLISTALLYLTARTLLPGCARGVPQGIAEVGLNAFTAETGPMRRSMGEGQVPGWPRSRSGNATPIWPALAEILAEAQPLRQLGRA